MSNIQDLLYVSKYTVHTVCSIHKNVSTIGGQKRSTGHGAKQLQYFPLSINVPIN